MIADSPPDVFGNLIFKGWLEVSNNQFERISILDQLAYIANRGMGALAFRPVKKRPKNTTINIEEIIRILKQFLKNKQETVAEKLSRSALLNVFKIGTSAGGARLKFLIAQHKVDGNIIPGDLEYSDDYRHLLVKLSLNDDEKGYSNELITYRYYLVATSLNINMTASELIEHKHFATTGFDRKKIHILTACGMTGWDFTDDPKNSSYENLLKLATALKPATCTDRTII
ncbi:MAG TPA: HipA domain-containing protein [Arachidicoccus sp.]|nr:HipA domain-containing protein [Arachidicoccus sp.]